jgi:hypothetical protein
VELKKGFFTFQRLSPCHSHESDAVSPRAAASNL